jgi:hypothetical protein
LAALVPAEVLAVMSFLQPRFSDTAIRELETGVSTETVISDETAAVAAFWSLAVISIAIFIGGRRVNTKEKLGFLDVPRCLIPPAAFAGWLMLVDPSVVQLAVPPLESWSLGTMEVVAIVGGMALGIAASALAIQSDKQEPSSASRLTEDVHDATQIKVDE